MRLSNGADAIVVESTDEALKLDFNPPMAGKALTFEVELVKLTKVLLLPARQALLCIECLSAAHDMGLLPKDPSQELSVDCV